MFREAGARGFWRGAVPMFWCVPMQNAMLFVGYGYGERISGTSEGNSLTPVFVGGCLGGFVQSFVVAPAELLKVRESSFLFTFYFAGCACKMMLCDPRLQCAGMKQLLLLLCLTESPPPLATGSASAGTHGDRRLRHCGSDLSFFGRDPDLDERPHGDTVPRCASPWGLVCQVAPPAPC